MVVLGHMTVNIITTIAFYALFMASDVLPQDSTISFIFGDILIDPSMTNVHDLVAFTTMIDLFRTPIQAD